MKRWYLAFLVIIPLLIFLIVKGSRGTDTGFNKSKELAALRKVGHQLLLASGDSTSLVLPVREISENEFQIAFEKAFRLEPKLLVDVFRKTYPPTGDYSVEVRELAKTQVLYSFILSPDSAHTIVPCIGRIFPEAHYTITLKLPDTTQSGGYFIAGILVLLAGSGMWLYKRKEKPVTTTANTLGKFHFNV
jgi:LPXTG-motif cell wall-anchored protein